MRALSVGPRQNALGGTHEMLARKELGEYGPVIHLEEDARTLATLLQLCYPFADFEVTSGDVPSSSFPE